jgi:hypothetical protein
MLRFLKYLGVLLFLVVFVLAGSYGLMLLLLNSIGPQGTYTISGRVTGLENSTTISHPNELSVSLDNLSINGCDVVARNCYSGVEFESYVVPYGELNGITIGDQVTLQCVVTPTSLDIRQMINRVDCSGLTKIK